jgi:hypothetical protein
LRRCSVLRFCKPFQHINDRPIRSEVLRRKAVEADSQLLAGRTHAVPFSLSFHEREFGLNGGHRLHRVRSADCFRTRLREAEVQHLALLDEIFDRTSHLFDRYGWIHSVLVIEIDAIGSKALEGALNDLREVVWPAVETTGFDVKAELACDAHSVTEGRERFANKIRG